MITASGLATGLDVDSIVSQLVNAESAAPIRRLAVRESKLQGDIAAISAVSGALSGLGGTLDALKSDSSFAQRTATSSDSSIFSASASSSAQASSYDVEVVTLAVAQKQASGAYADADTEVTTGTGTLSFEVDGESFDLTIDSDNRTLAGIRDAINNADDNTGVSASIIKVSDTESRLVLSASDTGLSKVVNVSSPSADPELDSFIAGLTQTQAAVDANVLIEGFSFSGASNTFSDAIEGVTITLKQADAGNNQVLTVGLDTGAISKAMSDFVKSLNGAVTTIANLTAYNAETGASSALQGDSMMRTLSNRLRNLAFDDYSDTNTAFSSLAEVGVKFDGSGELSIDSEVLEEALRTNFDDVVNLVSGSNGLRERFDGLVDSYVESEGQLSSRSDSLQVSLERLNNDRERLNSRIGQIEERYRRQFSALELLVSSLNQTSSFLAQQLQNLNPQS